MASSVDFILNLNGDQARKVLLDLHRQGNSLFSKTGYDLRLNSKGFNRSLDQATDRVLSFTAATTIFSTVGLAMRRLASDAITVETSIAQIQSILNATSNDLSGFTDSLFKLANKTGVGFSDAAKAAEEFSRQGLTLEKTLKATEAALSLARVSGGNLEKTVGNLVSITSAFANEALVFEDVADTLGALDAAFSTTTTGLAEGLSRVSAVANGVGVSFKEMASLIAATKQVTGRSEAVIGNAFKSIFTNIGTDKVQEELRAVGVETRNLDGTFIDAEKVIASLAERYGDLTDAQRANISFKVAGKYNKNILEGAIFAQNQGVSEKAFKVAESSAGSIAERLALLNETTATSLQMLQNSITQLSTGEVGGLFTELSKEAATFAKGFVDGVVEIFAKGNPVGKAIADGIGGALKGPVLTLGLLLVGKIIQKVGVDLLRAGKSVLTTNGGFLTQKNILMQINEEIAKGNALLGKRSAIASSGIGVAGAAGLVAPNIKSAKYQSRAGLNTSTSTAIPGNYLADRSTYNKKVRDASLAEQASMAQTKEATEKQLKSDRFRTRAFGASFAAPLAGSFAEQAIGGGAGKIAGGLGEGASVAALGLAFGGIVAPIGIAIGVLEAFGTITEVAFGDFSQLNQILKDNVGEIEKNIQAGSAYIAAQRDYNAALKSGDAELIVKTAKELSTAGRNLTGDRRKLLSLSDPKEQQNLLNQLDKTSEGLANASLAAITANSIVAKSYEGTFDKIRSLFGDQKVFSQAEITEGAAAIGRGINPSDIKDISGIQSRFAQTGNSQEIQDVIGGIIAKTPDLENAFVTIARKGDGAAEQLSLATLAYVANQKISEELAESQKNLQKTSTELNRAFKTVVSRTFLNREELAKDQASRVQTDIGVRRILGGESGGIQAIRNEAGFDIEEIENRSKIEISQLQQSFIKKVQDTIENSVTDPTDKLKGKDFISKISSPDYDFTEVLNDYAKNVSEAGFSDVKRANEELVTETLKSKNLLSRESESIKKQTAAREAVEKRKSSATSFGPLTGDQTDSRNIAAAGRRAENKVLSFREIDDKEAEDILTKAESEKSRGASVSGDRAALIIAARRRINLNSKLEGSGVVGGKIEQAIQENADFNKVRGLVNPNQTNNKQLAKKIDEQLSLKKFDEAEKLAGQLDVRDKSQVVNAIREQKEKSSTIEKSAEDYVADLMGDKVNVPINDNTTATKDNTQEMGGLKSEISSLKDKISQTPQSAGAMEDKEAKIAEDNLRRKAQASIIETDLQKNVIVPLKEKGSQQAAIAEAKAGLATFLEGSREGTGRLSGTESTLQALDLIPLGGLPARSLKSGVLPGSGSRLQLEALPKEEAATFTQVKNKLLGSPEGFPNLAGLKTTPVEGDVVSEIYGNPSLKTSEARKSEFVKRLGEQRGGEIFGAAERFTNKNKELEGVSISDSKTLDKEIQVLREKKEEGLKQIEALNEQRKAAEGMNQAAQSIETSSKNMESAAASISKGMEQTFKGLLDVSFTGADFLQNTKVVAELESTIKRLFIQYRKEETGKEPALAPTNPRTAVA